MTLDGLEVSKNFRKTLEKAKKIVQNFFPKKEGGSAGHPHSPATRRWVGVPHSSLSMHRRVRRQGKNYTPVLV